MNLKNVLEKLIGESNIEKPNIVFQDLKKEYSDFVLISPQGGMNHFGNEFDNIKKGGVPFEVNDKTLYIVSS